MKKIYFLLAIVFFTSIFYSCTYTALEDVNPEGPTGPMSFATDIVPIFSKCTSCHPSSAGLDLTSENAYENVMDGRVDIDNPDQSLIYTKPSPDGNHPVKYSSLEATKVLNWINEGAENN